MAIHSIRSVLGAAAFALTAVTVVTAQPPQASPPVAPPPLFAKTSPVRSCESLAGVALPNTRIDSAVVDPGNATTPASCRITAIVTHPPAGDAVKIFIGLPLQNWNGRFQGVGGGGFSGGSALGVRQPLTTGYAAGATDTGHEGGSGSFALDGAPTPARTERAPGAPAGRLNWQLIRDNAYLGIHEMTVTGKALTREFYGNAPRYAYFNGCSTGGRQGLMEAQRYPADYDGILSGAPAINWPKLHVEQMWGPLVMLEAHNAVAPCKFAAATAAAVAACDTIDGVTDGVIEDPARCSYDPNALVGSAAGECGAITAADAMVVRKIWDGPRRQDGTFLWHGLTRGADFSGLSATTGTPLTPRPQSITLDWWRYFLTQNPQWDWTALSHASYEQFWDQSIEEFGAVIGTDNPDLSAFRDRGGRIVLWHGQSDPLIYPGGTIDYFTRVQQQMGGRAKTDEFIRLFMAPGVGHCGGGAGPAPVGQFDAVVKWVEQGHAPETLTAVRRDQTGAVVRSRPLCRYPLVARYKGRGSTDDAASFECRASF